MRIAKVKAHTLKQVTEKALEAYRNGAPFKTLRNDPVLRDNWISITAVDWNAADQAVYLGLTAFDKDLLWRFRPESGAFESLGCKGCIADPQAVKIHRGLTPDGQGGYYFGTAGLPDLDELQDAPGGGIYHYAKGKLELLGIPIPHTYIQNVEVDLARQRVYGVTYPLLYFFDYDLKTRRTGYSFYTGSHFHESGLDDSGYLWGTWQTRRGHCLFRYHPDIGRPDFFEKPIPCATLDYPWNFPMNGPVDSFINGKDGFLYFGTLQGELYRLEPRSGEILLLGRPSKGLRLSGLSLGPQGQLIGSYGADFETGLFLYDRQKGVFTDLGALRDEDGKACFMIHDIIWDGGQRVFAGETDNLDRSAYLWEAILE